MDLDFLSQADNATLKLELAKIALETAKANLEAAKQAYEDVLAQADHHGIPRAKLKKLAEDRVQALIDSGLVSVTARSDGAKADARKERPKKTKAEAKETGDEESLHLASTDAPPAELGTPV